MFSPTVPEIDHEDRLTGKSEIHGLRVHKVVRNSEIKKIKKTFISVSM
jgi:hypothetical protein